ncbi:MAG: hypothetical protein TEF_00650 [Rhizobiales bacterium NRL2]|jgi:hypothetical protein|nr:MAG: hypothetical protein TEF_00650 [Rhizobiales bacterium NRL2]
MKRTAIAIASAAALAAAATPATAADGQGRFAVKGAGQVSCQKFIQMRQNKDSREYAMTQGWIQGYLTASNRHMPDTFDLTPWQSTELIATLIEESCQGGSDARLAAMAGAVAQGLSEHRLDSNSPTQQFSVAGQNYVMHKATIAQMQRRLQDMGAYNGAIDGSFGPNTQGAIQKFQSAVDGLDATGAPTQVTLFYLLLGEMQG